MDRVHEGKLIPQESHQQRSAQSLWPPTHFFHCGIDLDVSDNLNGIFSGNDTDVDVDPDVDSNVDADTSADSTTDGGEDNEGLLAGLF